MVHIVALGDGLTQGYKDQGNKGWFTRLTELIADDPPGQYTFSNLSGIEDRTLDIKHKLGNALMQAPDLMIIAIGVNDIRRWDEADGSMDQHMEARREAWDVILSVLRQSGINTLVVFNRPVLNDVLKYDKAYWGKTCFFKNKDIASYNEDIATWCNIAGIPFLDCWQEWLDAGIGNLLDKEGFYATAKGHKLLANQVYSEMEKQLFI